MARRRYISTKISLDKLVNRLAMEHGDFAALLYTWLIPHAEDDCTLPTDPEEILMTVFPGRRDKTAADVKKAIEAIVTIGLLEYSESGKLREKPASFYTYQTYISEKNRTTEMAAPLKKAVETADIAEERRKTPENTASFSPSFSVSPSFSPSPSFSVRDEGTGGVGGTNIPDGLSSSDKDVMKRYNFSDDMRSKIEDWLAYKRERHENYRPIGLTSLLSELQNSVARYGEPAVMEIISASMAANYKGIVLDRLSSAALSRASPSRETDLQRRKRILDKKIQQDMEAYGDGNNRGNTQIGTGYSVILPRLEDGSDKRF